jgi:DNA-binding LacI/PurR family transcriptional regulator
LGLKVPDDLSVMGFDGVPLAEYTIPRLTTIEIHAEKLAAVAVEMMMTRLHSKTKSEGETRKLGCSLRIGESSAPLAELSQNKSL